MRHLVARLAAAVTLAVGASASAQDVPAIVTRARLDPTQGVNFHAVILRDTVYVGEQVTYQVGVFLDDDTRLRLRRSPEFVPAEAQGMLGYDVAGSRATPTRIVDGRRYEAHVFQRALFPLTAGRLVIPPAQLIYTLPLSSSFFSREESHTVRTERLEVTAIAPPALGQPADYDGAVGTITARASLDSADPRVGDPVTLTVRVAGIGNVKLFPRPRLDLSWASAVPSGEHVNVDTTAPVIAGEKLFQWILTPREAGPHELPAVRYPYFDPTARRYEVAVTDPLRIDIAAGSLAAEPTTGARRDAPSVRRVYRGPMPDPTPLTMPFWAVAALAPAPALALRGLRRVRRPRGPRPAARLRQVARRVARDHHVRDLRAAFADALAWRVGVHPLALSAPGAASRALRRAGVTVTVAADAERLLADLSRDAFDGAGAAASTDAARNALAIYRRVDGEAVLRPDVPPPRPLGRARSASLIALIAGASLAATAWASSTGAAREFAEGLRAYDAGEYAAAARHFADAGAAEPRAADAWANAGTAAWVGADTAAAVVGWQRALRLEPSATDARERLEANAPSAGSAEAAVPRVPPAATALVALLLWCAAWFLALVRTRRGRSWGRAAAALAVAGLVAGGSALWAWRALEATNLRVVAERAPIRVAAALGADQIAVAVVGEVARVEEQRGAWSRVRLGNDRDGWIESPALMPIAVPPSSRPVR